MWVIAVYHQVSLFSLKPSDTTSTGGKSLLVPSPYSIKMAVLDAAIRAYGVRIGSEVFTLLRESAIALSPPPYIIVNNCFVRIQKRRRPKSRKERASGKRTEEGTTSLLEDEEGEGEEEAAGEGLGPYGRSISFREYVQYSGPLGLALQVSESDKAARLSQLLPLINYLGKRGGFFQLDNLPFIRELLPHQQGYL